MVPIWNPCYTIAYGNPLAHIQVVEYISFHCPSCSKLFTQDFAHFKRTYVDTGKVQWTFHPYPLDRCTVEAMAHLQTLYPEEKKLFLEAILPQIHSQEFSSEEISYMMRACLDILGKSPRDFSTTKKLVSTPAFKKAFAFLQERKDIKGAPTIEVNERVMPGMPTRKRVEPPFTNLYEEVIIMKQRYFVLLFSWASLSTLCFSASSLDQRPKRSPFPNVETLRNFRRLYCRGQGRACPNYCTWEKGTARAYLIYREE